MHFTKLPPYFWLCLSSLRVMCSVRRILHENCCGLKNKQNPATLGNFLTSGIQQQFNCRKLIVKTWTKNRGQTPVSFISALMYYKMQWNSIAATQAFFYAIISTLCHISYDKTKFNCLISLQNFTIITEKLSATMCFSINVQLTYSTMDTLVQFQPFLPSNGIGYGITWQLWQPTNYTLDTLLLKQIHSPHKLNTTISPKLICFTLTSPYQLLYS